MTLLLPSLAGGLIAIGILGVIVGLRPTAVPPRERPKARGRRFALTSRTRILLLVGIGLGILGWVVTGWVLAVVIAPVAVLGLPALLSAPPAATQINRLEAMEEWTRSLSGVLTVGIGLEQALVATLKSAPESIRPEVTALISRLRAQWTTRDALRQFAADLQDPTGDLIAMTLMLSATRRGSGLSSVLTGLAETVAQEVKNRRAIEADRSRPRATARWITLITVLGVIYLALNPTYSAPYSTPLGQVLFLVYMVGVIAALIWMRRMTTGTPPPRILHDTPPSSAPTTAQEPIR